MFQITIPKPCNEDWNKMEPTATGAFCKSCAKEVIDFTKMTDDEVQNYFLNRPNSGICGKFKKEQIQRIKIELPANIFYAKTARWKKFMAIVLLAFGSMLFGCDVNTADSIPMGVALTEVQKKDTSCAFLMGPPPPQIKFDSIQTIRPKEKIVGALVLPPITTKDSNLIILPSEINGEVDFVPIDSTNLKPIPDSNNQLKTKPVIDTLITE